MYGAGTLRLVQFGNNENQGVFWSWERAEIQSDKIVGMHS